MSTGTLGTTTRGETTVHLRVESADRVAGGAVAVLTLAASDGADLPSWRPGAHIELLLPDGGVRQYSLCGPRTGGTWRIGVLREPGGRGGSAWVHTALRAGDGIEARGPHHGFDLVEAPGYVFVAGGIGITPLLPMVAEVAGRGVPWRLVYGGRSMASMAFLDELAVYGDHVTVHPQDEVGHIDVAGVVAATAPGWAVYCCGPGPLLDAMEEAMVTRPAGSLHVERFRPRAGADAGAHTAFEVHLDHSDITLTVGPGDSIADAVERAGVDVATSCREGTCGTCETAVLGGVPDHRDSYLSREDREAGDTIMICCSRSASPRLVLDL